MKNIFGKTSLVVIATALSLFVFSTTFASISVGAGLRASTTASSTRAIKLDAKLNQAKARGDNEIDRRIEALNKISTRIGEVKNISAGDKSALSAEIQTQVSALTALKSKLDADESTTTIKADIQSITKSYRIYALVLPQISIMAAADRINTVADLITGVSTKVQVRVNAAQTAGKDVTTLQTALADILAKATDAKVQSQAATSLVATLLPDNGDAGVAASNKAALVSARAKIKAGTADLEAARKDIKKIIEALKDFHLDGGVNASTTASSTISQ